MASRRKVKATTTAKVGEKIVLALCNGFERDMLTERVEVVVGSDGVIETNLSVNENGTCWKATGMDVPKVFWVYAPTNGEVQEVDLVHGELPRNTLPNLSHTDGRTAAANIEHIYGEIACGQEVIGEEEQRFLCRFEEGIGVEEDVEVCALNEALVERYTDGR